MKKSSKAVSSARKRAKAKEENRLLALAKKAARLPATHDYTLITLDALTRKPIAPKKGQQVFFAWKRKDGKIFPIESKYSQAYFPSDAVGILAAFKLGEPSAYNVYKELTQTVSQVIDKDGNPVTETSLNKQTGEVKTLYRWKLTGRNPRKAQSTSVHSISKFLMPLTRGFVPQRPAEIPRGRYVKVPVSFGKTKFPETDCGFFSGDSIRDTLNYILPDVTTAELARRGTKTLVANGAVTAYRPENPYAEETPDWVDREKWTRKIWHDRDTRTFRVAGEVPALMNFASRIATHFRKSFSRAGLRVTSLVELEDAQARQMDLDETVFKMLDPVWPKIILDPEAGVRYKFEKNKDFVSQVPADKFHPMRYEASGGEASDRVGSNYETVLHLSMSIKGF